MKVTRRDHITIPVAFGKKFGIKEGDRLLVEATEKGILFKPIPKLEDWQAWTRNTAHQKTLRRN